MMNIIKTPPKGISGFLILLLISLAACNNSTDQTPVSIISGTTGDTLENKLTPIIEDLMVRYDLPGLAIGIVKEGEIVYAKAFGYKSNETGEPVTIQSLFHMASVSKPFVATAIMQLVEQGKIVLDSSVVHYLPYFQLEGGPYEMITVKQMLNHISGMPDVRDYEWDNPIYDEGALEQYVRSISTEELIADPGERFAYSNMAFECLGDVIGKVSGTSFADYVKTNILDPIGMEESTFLKPEYLPDNWASPHTRILSSKPWDGYPYNRMHGPSSTLHSNVLEMCKWAMANMNRGILGNAMILESSSYDQLWNHWFQTGEENHVGLSWFIGKFRDVETIGHSGGDMGFNTDFVMVPDKSIAVVVLSNVNPAPVVEIKSIALDILLGYEPQSLKSPASIPVLKELESNGFDAAASMWDSLSMNHPEDYDFSPQHFIGLLYAIDLDLVEEAVSISQLCLKIFPDEIIHEIEVQAEWYGNNHPENKAAPAVLKVFQDSKKDAQ